MIGALVSWFAGGGVAAIGKQLTHAYELKLSAANDHDRIEADKDIATLQAQQAVLIAEQGDWRTSWVRPAFAAPFVIHNFAYIILDRVLGWMTVAPLSEHFMLLEAIVFGAYFVSRPFEKRRHKR